MPKRRANEEIFQDGDRSIRLVADFGFLESLNSLGRDVAIIFAGLSEGELNPTDIKNIIVCALVDIDGDEVKESDLEGVTEDLIERYGLQECSVMARILLSYALIGDIKKLGAGRAAKYQAIIDQFLPSQSISLKKVGLLWAVNCMTSAALVCLIFSYCSQCII